MWKLAPALETLRTQLNKAYPNRSKASDGTIGDVLHSARQSDHNPDQHGIVAAMDITHDPRRGVDGLSLAERLICDPRVKYVIFDRRIRCPGKAWQPYSGANPHDKHVHVSVRADRYNDPREWEIKEDDMVTITGLNYIFRLLHGASPTIAEKTKYVGKMSFDDVAKAEESTQRYKERQKQIKAAKAILNSHLPNKLR